MWGISVLSHVELDRLNPETFTVETENDCKVRKSWRKMTVYSLLDSSLLGKL